MIDITRPTDGIGIHTWLRPKVLGVRVPRRVPWRCGLIGIGGKLKPYYFAGSSPAIVTKYSMRFW